MLGHKNQSVMVMRSTHALISLTDPFMPLLEKDGVLIGLPPSLLDASDAAVFSNQKSPDTPS
jgi:hypothetical protein